MSGDSPELLFYLPDELREKGLLFEPPRDGDAGFDIRSAADLLVPPGDQAIVPTGLRLAIPIGWVGIVKDRSSMAARRIYTHGGVIDAGYRGELRIVLSNAGPEPFEISFGLKVAQLVVVPSLVVGSPVRSIEELGVSARGESGFGSTGR